MAQAEIQVKSYPGLEEWNSVWVSPFSSDPLHHFNASQQAGPSLPHAAVLLEVVLVGQEVELDHAEHPITILDKHTEPGQKKQKDTIGLV